MPVLLAAVTFDSIYGLFVCSYQGNARLALVLITAVTPQANAMQILPAIILLCLGSPLQTLALHSPRAADWVPSYGDYMAMRTTQLNPLAALQQLPSLELLGLDTLGMTLARTLCLLTALTYLRSTLETDCAAGSAHGAFNAGGDLTQLQELHVSGGQHTEAQQLSTKMSRLVRLRQLKVHDVRFSHTSHVLTALTAVEQLEILLPTSQPPADGPSPQNPLPPGMHALRNLQELRINCICQPMPPLALPALTELQLVAPAFGGEVSPFLAA